MAEGISDDSSPDTLKVSSLLKTLTGCVSNAESSLPRLQKNDSSDVTIAPPRDGISLLDAKSDLFLSYLHNLVFLILFQLREISPSKSQTRHLGGHIDDHSPLPGDIIHKLAELRVYLERGVRPLEAKLKYQIDKVVKAAEDARGVRRAAPATKNAKKRVSMKDAISGDEGRSASSEVHAFNNEQSDNAEDDDADEDEVEEDIDEMAYRPNISAFVQAANPTTEKPKLSTSKFPDDGIYRPPKIKPTALPTTDRREARETPRPRKSRVIDEFVNVEMSVAPIAEPSIGSMIQKGGRRIISQQERDREAERREYEEGNFVRLPKDNKKERANRRARDGRESGFGGEELRLLTEDADRIGRLTRRAQGSGGALERSRKRRLTEDGPRADGAAIGQIFEKRRKKVESWKK